jgi:hypothetical protein
MEKRLSRAELLAAVDTTSNALEMKRHRNQLPFPCGREGEPYGAMHCVWWRLADALVPTFGRDNAADVVRRYPDIVYELVWRIENEGAQGLVFFVGCPPDGNLMPFGGTRGEIAADLERLTAEDKALSASFVDVDKLLADVRAQAKAGSVDLSGPVFVLTPEEEAERRERLHEAIAERRQAKQRPKPGPPATRQAPAKLQ